MSVPDQVPKTELVVSGASVTQFDYDFYVAGRGRRETGPPLPSPPSSSLGACEQPGLLEEAFHPKSPSPKFGRRGVRVPVLRRPCPPTPH